MHCCVRFLLGLTWWRRQGGNLSLITCLLDHLLSWWMIVCLLDHLLSFSFSSVHWSFASLTTLPHNRRASTLEAFEHHLMSYRGIHKHCDTCRHILDEGEQVKQLWVEVVVWVKLCRSILNQEEEEEQPGRRVKGSRKSSSSSLLSSSSPSSSLSTRKPKDKEETRRSRSKRNEPDDSEIIERRSNVSRLLNRCIVLSPDWEPDKPIQLWRRGFDKRWRWEYWEAQVESINWICSISPSSKELTMKMYKLQACQSLDCLGWERTGQWRTSSLTKMNLLLPMFGSIILNLSFTSKVHLKIFALGDNLIQQKQYGCSTVVLQVDWMGLGWIEYLRVRWKNPSQPTESGSSWLKIHEKMPFFPPNVLFCLTNCPF